MFNIIVDHTLLDTRNRANQGSVEDMLHLAHCVGEGLETRQNIDKALAILDHVIALNDALSFREYYWNALMQKSQLLWDRGDYDSIDMLMETLIQDMAKYDPKRWYVEQLAWASGWLSNRKIEEIPSQFEE